MLAPDAETKALRDGGVPTESWRPAGLFNVLRAINVLRRAVDRFEPDAIHAFGWTAAAVALGALPTRYARRTLVTLQDPIRKNEMPKTFVEKRLPELFARGWAVHCAYETLRRVLVDALGVPAAQSSRVVPYAVAFGGSDALAPAGGSPWPDRGLRGPAGVGSRLGDCDRRCGPVAAKRCPHARLAMGRSGPVAGLVRAHARLAGIAERSAFSTILSLAELFAGIDMLVVPGSFDGLPYALVEALVAGVPLIGADAGGIADTLAPYAGWLVPDDARRLRRRNRGSVVGHRRRLGSRAGATGARRRRVLAADAARGTARAYARMADEPVATGRRIVNRLTANGEF